MCRAWVSRFPGHGALWTVKEQKTNQLLQAVGAQPMNTHTRLLELLSPLGVVASSIVSSDVWPNLKRVLSWLASLCRLHLVCQLARPFKCPTRPVAQLHSEFVFVSCTIRVDPRSLLPPNPV